MTTGIHHVGPALRMLREKQERRQGEVASAAGVTQAMLSAFERGRRRPSLGSLDNILAALGAHLFDLAVACRRVESAAVEAPTTKGGAMRTSLALALALVALVAIAAPVAGQEPEPHVVAGRLVGCPVGSSCFEVAGVVVERRAVWRDFLRQHVERLVFAGSDAVYYCPQPNTPAGSPTLDCGEVEVGERYHAVGLVVRLEDGSESHRIASITPAPLLQR